MPDPAGLAGLLRTEVGRFRQAERRRRFDPGIHVGAVAGERATVVVPARQREYLDRQVRVDLVSALLEEADHAAFAWVSRPGVAVLEDDDTSWGVAAQVAFGAAGRQLEGFFVITREGWLDVRTGDRRVWKRLRLER